MVIILQMTYDNVHLIQKLVHIMKILMLHKYIILGLKFSLKTVMTILNMVFTLLEIMIKLSYTVLVGVRFQNYSLKLFLWSRYLQIKQIHQFLKSILFHI
jgi:hypothetical protein